MFTGRGIALYKVPPHPPSMEVPPPLVVLAPVPAVPVAPVPIAPVPIAPVLVAPVPVAPVPPAFAPPPVLAPVPLVLLQPEASAANVDMTIPRAVSGLFKLPFNDMSNLPYPSGAIKKVVI
jgi:hypothetical protein